MLIKEIAEQYLEKRRKKERFGNLRKPTILKIENIISNHIIKHFGSIEISDFDEETWENYLDSEARNKKEVWVYMRSVLKFSQNMGEIKKLPDLIKPRPSEYQGRALTHEEAEKLLKASQSAGEIGLFVQLCLLHGARPGEMYKLKWDRIDLDKGIVHLKKQDVKTKRARSFPIFSSPILEKSPLESLRELKQDDLSEYVFPNNAGKTHRSHFWIAKKFEELIRDAGITGRFTPHGMRHTFLTHAALKIKSENANFSIVDVVSMAGLTIGIFEKTYLHVRPDDLNTLGGVFG